MHRGLATVGSCFRARCAAEIARRAPSPACNASPTAVRGCAALVEKIPVSVSTCYRACGVVALTFTVQYAHAQNTAAETAKAVLLDPIVVTATRSPERLSTLLADVTVIGPDEIARAGQSGLLDLLSRQPAVEVATNGGPASTSAVFLRGANNAQTLVLLDGVRIGSSTSGTAPYEAIPVDQIARIEILRGPASSLYGADALGGVLQIFSKRGEQGVERLNADAGQGLYDPAQI